MRTYLISKPAQDNGQAPVRSKTGFIAPGDVTMLIDLNLLKLPSPLDVRGRGHPVVYTNALMQMLLSLRQIFGLPLRALADFTLMLSKVAFPGLPVPDYTTLSRRIRNIRVALPVRRPHEAMYLIIGGVGLKVYREPQWKKCEQDFPRRHTWQKVKLKMDSDTGQIHAALA